jgi:hypothetical protein
MIRLGVLGGLLLALTLSALTLYTPGTGALTVPANAVFVSIAAASACVYLAAVWLVLNRPPPRRAIWVVLLVAAALRVALVPFPIFLSSDANRYVWDGRVQLAGINPYRYLPVDPALAPLREEAIFPHINRADTARTIYPPAAQVVFAAAALIWPTISGIKAVMVSFEVFAVACLLTLLKVARLPAERILIYAWNPLPVWAFAGNGHVDAIAIGCVCAALLLRVQRRDGWAGVLLGAAVATKFLPAVIAPVLWRRAARWRLGVAAAVTVLGLYAIYVGVGWHVFGYLGGYGEEEGIASGTGIWLLAGLDRLVPLRPFAAPLYLTACAAGLAALGAWFAFVRRPDDPVALCGAAGIMMAALSFAISPHYPWYFAWLAAPCVIAPNRAVLWMSVSPILLYLDTDGDHFLWPSVVFVPALLLALAALYRPRPALASIKGNT